MYNFFNKRNNISLLCRLASSKEKEDICYVFVWVNNYITVENIYNITEVI